MKDGSIKLDSSAVLFCPTDSCSKLISSIRDRAVLSNSAANKERKRKAPILVECNNTLVAVVMVHV